MKQGVEVKFTERQKKQILALRKIGLSYREIGERYNVSDNLISSRIKKWKKGDNQVIKLNDKQRDYYFGFFQEMDFYNVGDLFITKDSDEWGYQIVNEDRSYTDYVPMDVYQKIKTKGE